GQRTDVNHGKSLIGTGRAGKGGRGVAVSARSESRLCLRRRTPRYGERGQCRQKRNSRCAPIKTLGPTLPTLRSYASACSALKCRRNLLFAASAGHGVR